MPGGSTDIGLIISILKKLKGNHVQRTKGNYEKDRGYQIENICKEINYKKEQTRNSGMRSVITEVGNWPERFNNRFEKKKERLIL